MNIIVSLILIGGGLVSALYLRKKAKDSVLEMKYMQTKSISDLIDMFNQMDENGLGNDYREFVELKGNIVNNELVETPFSSRKVAYYEAKLSQVVENVSQYRDSNGNLRTKTSNSEIEISNETSSQEIYIKDSSDKTVTVEINATGCNADIPKTLDKFERKDNLSKYRYFNSFSFNRYGSDTIGFKMEEKTINENQNIYVLGEAFKVGNDIHIGKPQDSKKPFIVTTKSEEDFINTSNKKSISYLIGGIIAIITGIIMLFS